jgi:glycerophosphoryl diester phosphodiesterase
MKKNSMVLLTIFFLVFVYAFVSVSPVMYMGNDTVKDSLKNSVILTGHRGAGGLAPENTIAAIDTGMSLGVNRVEVDVRQTKDGIVVCIHDNKIDRTTNGKGPVNDFTYNELLQFDAGTWFSSEFKSEKIPTLEEVLKQTLNKVCLVIEIKDGNELYPGIEKNVVDLIHKYNAKQFAIVHSFNDSVLLRIHKIEPEIKLHKLFIIDFPLLPIIYDGNFRITNLEYYSFVEEFSVFLPFITKGLINDVHKLNKKINVWTVNDSTKIKRLINLGVDGIITDYPNYIQRKK